MAEGPYSGLHQYHIGGDDNNDDEDDVASIDGDDCNDYDHDNDNDE